ncbi:MAG: hypothetical protein AB2794_12810 [Candidatus Thiodiazotropha endolucinida]
MKSTLASGIESARASATEILHLAPAGGFFPTKGILFSASLNLRSQASKGKVMFLSKLRLGRVRDVSVA